MFSYCLDTNIDRKKITLILSIIPRSLSFKTLLHCFIMHSSVHAVTLTFLVAVSWAKTPQVVRWNTTDYYGPDGPWQVRLQFRS